MLMNGIDIGFVKNRLVKFKIMDKSMFNLYLKEIEFKSNNYKHNLYKILFVVAIKELF
jgi:transposase-like protein